MAKWQGASVRGTRDPIRRRGVAGPLQWRESAMPSVHSPTSSTKIGFSLAAAANQPLELIRTVIRMLKHRRDAAVLASLDDRMLADLGLTRSDLRDALSGPFWRDPTALLVSRVRERRHAGRERRARRIEGGSMFAPSIVPSGPFERVKRPSSGPAAREAC
jgi:uncharacterized protein YjiS (DUF1127 family)